MNGLIKRMCILKQLKTGFSADGNPLNGVVRVERYGKICTVQLSLINFAPLSDGRYLCVLCDKQGERIVFPVVPPTGEFKEEGGLFNPEKGFCSLVCFLRNGEVSRLAAGQYGAGGYNLNLLLSGVGTSLSDSSSSVSAVEKTPRKEEIDLPMPEKEEKKKEKEIVFVRESDYDDEAISGQNYYSEASESGKGSSAEDITHENAVAESETQTTEGDCASKDDETENVLHPFKIADGQSYYYKIKDELENLFAVSPRVNDLTASIPDSEWVRVDGADGCLVGIIYENLEIRYIAYALPACGKEPPESLPDSCFVPVDPFSEESGGYFVLFQDAATGETLRVSRS